MGNAMVKGIMGDSTTTFVWVARAVMDVICIGSGDGIFGKETP